MKFRGFLFCSDERFCDLISFVPILLRSLWLVRFVFFSFSGVWSVLVVIA